MYAQCTLLIFISYSVKDGQQDIRDLVYSFQIIRNLVEEDQALSTLGSSWFFFPSPAGIFKVSCRESLHCSENSNKSCYLQSFNPLPASAVTDTSHCYQVQILVTAISDRYQSLLSATYSILVTAISDRYWSLLSGTYTGHCYQGQILVTAISDRYQSLLSGTYTSHCYP